MKLNNSKKQLAKIISDNGGWRDGVEFSVSTCDGVVIGSRSRPRYTSKYGWVANGGFFEDRIKLRSYLKNWHQTIVSCDEYFHLYPAQDADGWIEWKGGLCPVDIREVVDIQYREGTVIERADAGCFEWQHYALNTDIIAYRLHKKEQPHDVEPEAQDAEVEVVVENRTACHLYVTDKPTIEQLAAEYRNRRGYAERKQQEADEAKTEAEAKLAELVAAGKAVGLVVGVAEPGPVITEYWHLRKGDIISHTRTDGSGDVELSVILTEVEGYDGGLVILAKDYDGVEGWITAAGWRFIRRPAKEANNA